MHYSSLVIIECGTEKSIEQSVAEAMGHSQHECPLSFWDWYQIGGRWTGTFDGYDPEKDPANIIPCDICRGTGKRTDMVVTNGCNGCAGTGKRTKWPTQWGRHSGDIVPVESLTQEALDKFFRVVIGGDWSRVYGGEEYLPWKPTGERFVEREKPPLDWIKSKCAGHLAVVVDNHS